MRTLVHPGIRHHWDRLSGLLSSAAVEAAALLLTRLALGGVFWRSGRTKVVEGTWMELNETTRFLFESEYAGVPLPAGLSAQMALWGETVLPILLVLGLATRLSALGLIGMTLVIQLFVYPEAWWSTHSLWAAMALVLVARGGGLLSLDHVLARRVVP